MLSLNFGHLWGRDRASGATGYQLRSTKALRVAGFRFVERTSEEKGKEVKNSEAHSRNSYGMPLYGSSDGGYGCSGIRQD
jgi:hypothetical protein